VDLVVTGHDHVYERLRVGDLTYIVNGLGGNGRYGFGQPLPQTLARFQADFGALKVDVTEQQLTFSFYTQAGQLIDAATLTSSHIEARCGEMPA
jgi:hypothetical protein